MEHPLALKTKVWVQLPGDKYPAVIWGYTPTSYTLLWEETDQILFNVPHDVVVAVREDDPDE